MRVSLLMFCERRFMIHPLFFSFLCRLGGASTTYCHDRLSNRNEKKEEREGKKKNQPLDNLGCNKALIL